MPEENKVKDWVSLTTIGSISGLSASIWIFTNYSYSLINYFYGLIVTKPGDATAILDKTLYCVLVSLIMAIVLTPKVVSKFFPPVEDKTLRNFILALNIILVLSSSHGFQAGYSSVGTDMPSSTQNAAILFFDPEPWVKPKSMTTKIEFLRKEKNTLETAMLAANRKIDSLNRMMGVETNLSEMEDVSDQSTSIEQYTIALREVKHKYKTLLAQKSDSLQLATKYYNDIRSKFMVQLTYNRQYDSLLRVLEYEIRRDQLKQKAIIDAKRKIDSLDRMNEH